MQGLIFFFELFFVNLVLELVHLLIYVEEAEDEVHVLLVELFVEDLDWDFLVDAPHSGEGHVQGVYVGMVF